jgi:molybdopterin/thiamine biosynthesis adenylyltransferase
MIEKIVVIGLGGIGSFLSLVLCRYLNFTNYCKRVVLVDGDRYGRENFGRQNVSSQDDTKNKAEAQATHLKALFNTITITPVSQFVAEKNVMEVICEKSVVFLAVDNHTTRKVVSDQCKRLQNVVLISGGNEIIDGNVQVYLKKNGRSRTPPIEKFHPEIENPQDRSPADLSCEQLAHLAGSEQIIFTNLTAACLMLNAFYTIVTDKPLRYSEVYFDIEQNRVLPKQR